MAINPSNKGFKKSLDEHYVDKTGAIAFTNSIIDTDSRFVCVARPRRFGKTLALLSLIAYYSKGASSGDLFSSLDISKDPNFKKHLNQYNVIYWDMSRFVSSDNSEYQEFIDRFNSNATDDFIKFCPTAFENKTITTAVDAFKAVIDEIDEDFIFLIDEWDAPLRAGYTEKQKLKYIDILRNLFKSDMTSNVSLAYFTGIFPIGRYDTQSALNNFTDINMLRPIEELSSYFGFTSNEVKNLCKKENLDFSQAKIWYDGYKILGEDIYNPYSIRNLLKFKKFTSYWSQSATFKEPLEAINHNFDGLRECIFNLISGIKLVNMDISKYQNVITKLDSKEAVLAYLIHLGYLSYREITANSGEICIPNEEVRQEFIKEIANAQYNGYQEFFTKTYRLFNALLSEDESTVALGIEKCHNDMISQLDYNSEVALRYAVKYALFAAEEKYYDPEDEVRSGKGVADIVYLPKEEYMNSSPVVIIELKWNKSAESAIKQIEDKKYTSKYQNRGNGFVLVGINYDPKDKTHSCKIKKFSSK